MNHPTDCDCPDHDHEHPPDRHPLDHSDSSEAGTQDPHVAWDSIPSIPPVAWDSIPSALDPLEISAAGTQTYSGNGVRFHYPRNWTLTEELGPEQTTITVQSPETSFWMLSLFEDRPDPERIVESVMEAYESLYEDLDVYEPDAQVLGFPVIARELDFVCLDLVTSAAMIVFQTIDQSVLVMFQGEDRELESTRPVMEAITQSLLCDMDGDRADNSVSDDASVE